MNSQSPCTCVVVDVKQKWKLAAAAKSLQLCPTLCDPIDGSPPGSSIPGILKARTLEWVAISFSTAWKWKVKEKSLSRVWVFETPWTAAYQAPPSMGFSRQEYWSGLPLPSLQHIWPKLFTTFSLGLHVSYFCLMKHLLTLRKEKLGEKEKGDVIKGHNFPQLWTIYI